MRLFTALWPPPAALDELAGVLGAPGWPPAGLRPVERGRWHLTLCFHGDDADPDAELARLAGLAGMAAPRLRLAGAGTFPGVLHVPVHPASDADARALAALVTAAGGDAERFVPHLTLGRARHRHRRPRVPEPLRGFTGGWWTAPQATLVATTGSGYQVLGRAALRRAGGGRGSSGEGDW